MIYLDNSATTNYKPQIVVDTVNECITNFAFNPNRSGTKGALVLQQKLYETRRKLSLLFNNDSEQHVAFTSGCTEALNLAILGTARKGHIIISATEHNSVLRPVMQLKHKGYAEVSVVKPDKNGDVTVQEISKLIKPNTYLLCVNHCSNVNGKLQRLSDLGRFARNNDLLFLVDCAQSAGYQPLNMARDLVDMVAIPSHKGLHGIQGAGALIFNKRATPRPIKYGGTGTESDLVYQPTTLPDGLESGTLPTPAIMSMSAGVDWWLANYKQNAQNIAETQRLILDGLGKIPNIKLYSSANKSGIVAFNIGNRDSNEVADVLSQQYDIAVRGGLQCAPLMHKYLGTFEQGVVRASVSCVTTKQECYAFVKAVQEIAQS